MNEAPKQREKVEGGYSSRIPGLLFSLKLLRFLSPRRRQALRRKGGKKQLLCCRTLFIYMMAPFSSS